MARPYLSLRQVGGAIGCGTNRTSTGIHPELFERAEELTDSGKPGSQFFPNTELAKGAIAFSHVARFAQPALVDGRLGLVMAPGVRLFRVLQFRSTRGRIARVDAVADPRGYGSSNWWSLMTD